MTANTEIPRLDFSEWLNPDSKTDFAIDLVESFRVHGFARIKNHGIDQKLTQEVFSKMDPFFNQSDEAKRGYMVDGSAGQQGYNPMGVDREDISEFLQFTRLGDVATRAEAYQLFKEFKSLMGATWKVYKEFDRVGTELVRALGEGMRIGEDAFDHLIGNGISERYHTIRELNYPAIEKAEDNPRNLPRSGRHYDSSMITLLLIKRFAAGLALNRGSYEKPVWENVVSEADDLVINSGRTLNYLTDGFIPMTEHMVNIPGYPAAARKSVPFFYHPNLKKTYNCVFKHEGKVYNGEILGEDFLRRDLGRNRNDLTGSERLI